MKTATLIKELEGFTGEAKLYKLSEPIEYDTWEDEKHSTQFVVVSAAHAAFSGPETYIFPADDEGNVLNWGELDGSFQGDWNHEQALRNAGFEIA